MAIKLEQLCGFCNEENKWNMTDRKQFTEGLPQYSLLHRSKGVLTGQLKANRSAAGLWHLSCNWNLHLGQFAHWKHKQLCGQRPGTVRARDPSRSFSWISKHCRITPKFPPWWKNQNGRPPQFPFKSMSQYRINTKFPNITNMHSRHYYNGRTASNYKLFISVSLICII